MVHLNKNLKMGTICNFDLKESDRIKLKSFGENSEKNFETEYVNLITASEDILRKRKEEFNIKDFKLDHLASEQQEKLRELLENNSQVFSSSLLTLGLTEKVSPHLSLTQNFPIRTLPFPLPNSLEQTALAQINEMLHANIIRRSNSEWCCPMLLVKKRDSDSSTNPKFRLALDLRLLNSVIKSSSYPIPKISTIISNLASCKFFTTLDFGSAFWQVAFTSVFGTFKFMRMCFGLKTSSSVYQSLMDSILDEVRLPGVFSYIDDLVVGSNSFQETVEKISKIVDFYQSIT